MCLSRATPSAATAGEAPPEEKPTGGVVLSRKTAADIGGVSGAEALGIIRQPIGPFNWALYSPSDKGGLDLLNACVRRRR